MIVILDDDTDSFLLIHFALLPFDFSQRTTQVCNIFHTIFLEENRIMSTRGFVLVVYIKPVSANS